jgi:hypothetical protein
MLVLRQSKMLAIFGIVILSLWQTFAQSSVCADPPPPIIVEVSAGKFTHKDTPISIKLPNSMRGFKQFRLASDGDKNAVKVQIVPGKVPHLTWIIKKPLDPGKTRRYTLSAKLLVPPPTLQTTPVNKTISPGRPWVADDGKHLTVGVGQKKVLRYSHAVMASPVKDKPYYKRSGFIHPVYSPAGAVLTDDFPPDHLHQHGIMFPWTHTTFEGRKVDFWNQAAKQGTVEHSKTVSITKDGEVFAGFTAELRHLNLNAPGGAKTALNETWTVRVYNLNDYFLFDIESVQTCASKSPLKINKYHYGGMAIRGNRSWVNGNGGFVTSEAKSRKQGNHSRPNWCDIYGKVAGKDKGSHAGVTLLNHPDNFRFPQPVRLHPTMPYFCFTPMVLGEFQITPAKAYVSRYRFYVHSGKVDPAEADRLWNDYAHPPTVKFIDIP